MGSTIRTYLALGDSYTIGESVTEPERYPAQVIDILNKSGFSFQAPEIIAATGWTTTDLRHAIDNYHFKNPVYDIVSLLIGANNQYQGRSLSGYREQFTEILQHAAGLAGGEPSRVIVLSIPDYSVTPFAIDLNRPGIANEIDLFNNINKEISATYKVHYINITSESRKAASDKTLVSTDCLHYSGKEYAIWAGMLAETIKNIIRADRT
ncbi:MAG: SGNH/GDSL hydrolase family protein [Bacteroidetes bacterium]|nr:SGNH/GDSL hydrolase family protein [Bacteroidota bacterium]MBS1973968.1 SGNH/GDSL hydrolase family protein [Bacteroidota bacterium]